MEKKGFTLVELIAVIAVLGILLVLAIPNILSARDSAMRGLDKEEKRNIKEAGKMLGIDLDDYMTDVYNCKDASWMAGKCEKKDSSWTKATASIKDLRDYGYFTDDSKQCEGTITIEKSTGKNVTYNVTLNDDVKCL